MISLKKSMDLWEQAKEAERQYRVAVNAFARTLVALGRAGRRLTDCDEKCFSDRIETVRLQIEGEAESLNLDESAARVECEIDTFSLDLAQNIRKREGEYREIIRIVTEAAGTLSRVGEQRSQELKEYSRKLESVSCLQSIAEIRSQLSLRVRELKDIAARVERENEAQAKELQRQVEEMSADLRRAKVLAETDSLTGLLNRRGGEMCIADAMTSGRPFSLLIFDLNEFKSINDRFGHNQGDLLLKSVAANMRRTIRKQDGLCRWGGDEFVVVLKNCVLAAATELAARIADAAFGEFVLDGGGQTVCVSVDAEVGVAEYQPGESAGELLERADRSLYERKRCGPNPSGRRRQAELETLREDTALSV